MIDTKMQLGYKKMEKSDSIGACDIWYETWENILNIIGRTDIKTISEFDRAFKGTQSVFNWCQDFEMELGNAGLENKIYYKKRIIYCEEIINTFKGIDNLMLENMRRAISESYFNLGDRDKIDNLFEVWLKDDPKWGWGWIGWSDCYGWFKNRDKKDLEKAESILLRGYKIKGVRDKDSLIERLSDLYKEMGKKNENRDILKNNGNVSEEKDHIRDYAIEIMDGEEALNRGEIKENTPYFFGDKNLFNFSKGTSIPQDTKKKIGRNEPCPCGSGKKYKYCRGR
jgi:tetratricopeptide (TPR) repeat protein